MDFLLRLKAWQMFLILLVPIIFSSVDLKHAVIWYLMLIAIYTCWIYAIGIKMHSIIPEKIRPALASFKIYCLLYIAFAIPPIITVGYSGWPNVNPDFDFYILAAFILIDLYLSFNIWMFAARMLKTMLLGYPASRSDAIGEFFCIWMFPIGVWIIQPAVNKVLAKYDVNNA